jgi:hypothetical protein
MHYIRQLFEGKSEDWVHLLFTRYGRGEFDGPVCQADIGKNIKFSGSVEYCGTFVWLAGLCGGDWNVDGAIYAKRDFRDALEAAGVEFDDKSKPKKGVYLAQVTGEMPGAVLADVVEKMPDATVLLNLASDKGKLKCKKKPPKPGGEKDAAFFSGLLDVSVLGRMKEEVFFGAGEFKTAKVQNILKIEELVIPPGASAAEARLNAKRKGKVLRTVTVDGIEKKSECGFVV